MSEKSLSTSEAPQVVLKIHGNLQLKGIEESQVIAQVDSLEDLSLEGQDDRVRVECLSNAAVRVPRGAKVEIEKAYGNAEIKALEGELTIREFYGNLDLRSTGPTQLDLLRGNLSVKHLDGDLSMDAVDGNVTARDVVGSFMVSKMIRGNLNLDDVTGNVNAHADGNLLLRFDPLPGQRYEFKAGGNILCRLPEDASAKVHILSGNHILVNLGEVKLSEHKKVPLDVTLGDGDAELTFSADGNIQLRGQALDWDMGDFEIDFDGEFDDMAEQISQQVAQQIEAQVEMIEEQINAQMENLTAHLGSTGLSPEQMEQIAQRAREASARASARAQERMQQAQERIQRKMEAARRKAEDRVRAQQRRAQKAEKRSWSFEWPIPPAPPGRPTRPPAPEAPGESVSDEERLMILRMLQEKKITAEEAEQLLAALEGKVG